MGFKKIGKKIQAAREAKGMTQSDLAEKLEITQAALSNYELGKRRLYLHQIQKFSEILDKNLNYFIDDEHITSNDIFHMGDDNDISPAQLATLKDKVMSQLCTLSNEEMQLLSAFLDFLEWRKNSND